MGGLGGHIDHLYENLALSYSNLGQLIVDLAYGRVRGVYEKTDGQNLYVRWDPKSRSIKVARNKTHASSGGISKFELMAMFHDRPILQDTFAKAYETLQESIRSMDHRHLDKAFGRWHGSDVWYSVEILYKKNTNVIPYANDQIIFHRYGPSFWSEYSTPGLGGMSLISDEEAQERLEILAIALTKPINSWSLRPSRELLLHPNAAAVELAEQLQRKWSRKTKQIWQYHADELYENFFCRLISRQRSDRLAFRLLELPGALPLNDIIRDLPSQGKVTVKQAIARAQEHVPQMLEPLQIDIQTFATALLSGVKSVYVEDHAAALQHVTNLLESSENVIRASGSPEAVALLEHEKAKLHSYGGMKTAIEGVTLTYDNRIYKLTGAFAPINQICGIVRYGRGSARVT